MAANNIRTYTIREFSQKVNLSPFTLRYYEKEGLMPNSQRSPNSHRIYTDADAGWISFVCCLRSTGMSIIDIKRYVDLAVQGDKTVLQRRQIILQQKQKVEEQLKELKKNLKLINFKINYYDELIAKQLP
jgi:MerR family transcriptional regulator, aldehyde-responsive regulator